ncbi:MAG: hypothetical protein NTU51_00030 [Bacteroidetes bacterium]|nr:hypothetical protein [Bacteroidota bacterium]
MKKIGLFLFAFTAALIFGPVCFSQAGKGSAGAVVTKGDSKTVFDQLSQAQEAASILQAVQKQFQSFTLNIPENILVNYGFKNREEFKNVTFDTPFRVYIIKDSNIVFGSSWRVPVVVDNEYRALLTIILVNGDYQVADFGARVLAGELFAKKSAQTCGLLRVYELRSDYLIETSSSNQVQFIPVQGPGDKRLGLHDIFNLIKNKEL